MKHLAPRWLILLGLLWAAAAAQWALLAHVRDESNVQPARLTQPLAALPMELGEWVGRDVPINEQLDFADDALQRVYRHRTSGKQVTLWLAYSAIAADRSHHPEVCMAVLGKPENLAGRALLALPGHPQPIQQLKFGSTGESTWAFYWHYALHEQQRDGRDWTQRAYHRARHLPPSVTVEVFAADQAADDLAAARQFAATLDAALQPFVGNNARRSSSRLPITVVTGG